MLKPFNRWFGLFYLLVICLPNLPQASYDFKPVLPPSVQCKAQGEIICSLTPVIQMPEDYGVHPKHEREWWYYIGNALTDKNERVGFMLSVSRELQTYMATLTVMGPAISDQYWQTTLLTTLPKIQSGDPFSMNLRDIFNNEVSFTHDFGKKLLKLNGKIKNGQKSIFLSLTAKISKDGVLHGLGGFSQKSLVDPRVASLYSSETRMEIISDDLSTPPQIHLNQTVLNLARGGTLYHDHETSNSAPFAKSDFVGWDWIGLQFFDGSELVGFQMRKDNAPTYSATSLTEIFPDGTYRTSTQSQDLEMKPIGSMKLQSGITYPASFEVRVKKQGIEQFQTYYIVPLVKEAEMLRLFNIYGWYEGAVDIYSDPQFGKKVGWGFLEMTGYGKNPIGEYRRRPIFIN